MIQEKQSGRNSPFKVAALNFEPIMFQKERNIKALLEMTEEAARNGAKLILQPEMATTGYCWYSRQEIKPFVEPIPGETTERFCSLARRYHCWIVIGMPEVDPETNIYYNAAALVGPDGLVGKHRKTHPYISENKWSKEGDLGHQVFETPIGRIGLLICMDLHFFETARILALKGADVICHISNWLAEKTPAPYWITRAYENGCYLVESNRWGLERTVQFSGGSCIIEPDGKIQAYADSGDQICYGKIDIERARSKKFEQGGNKFSERKPDEYMGITLDSYLWNPLVFHSLYSFDSLPKGKKSRIAVVQCQTVLGDTPNNARRIAEKFKQATNDGNELVVFPELSLTGIPRDNAEALECAQAENGPEIWKLIDLCMSSRSYLVVSLVEKEGESLYNTALLLGPEGVVGKYRKIHLTQNDLRWATAGNLGFPHFNTPVGRIGMLIGHDLMFPEAARCLALAGVDLLCCPSAECNPKPFGLKKTSAPHNYPIPTGESPIHWHLWRVRAGENNVYLAFANQYGKTYDGGQMFGRSGIFGPDTFLFPRSEIIALESGDQLVSLTIDTSNGDSPYPTNIVRSKDLLCMRKAFWYDSICQRK